MVIGNKFKLLLMHSKYLLLVHSKDFTWHIYILFTSSCFTACHICNFKVNLSNINFHIGNIYQDEFLMYFNRIPFGDKNQSL